MDGDPTNKDAASDNTGDKQALTRFKPGTSGNPAGRPKGSRNKLATDFTDALADDFEQHGVAAIKKLRQTDNTNYLKIISNVLPRETLVKAFNVNLDAEATFGDDASIDDILEIVAKECGPENAILLASMFNIEVPESISPMIELNPEAETAWRTDPNNGEWRPPKRGRSPRTGE